MKGGKSVIQADRISTSARGRALTGRNRDTKGGVCELSHQPGGGEKAERTITCGAVTQWEIKGGMSKGRGWETTGQG